MPDDWRGEDLIRSKPLTTAEKQRRAQVPAQGLLNARRRAAGQGLSRSGGTWARQIHASALRATLEAKAGARDD